MEEPPEKTPEKSWEPESTTKSPNDSQADGQEDNLQKLYAKTVDRQTDLRTANQDDQKGPGQPELNIFDQVDHQVSEHNRHRTSDETDLRPSNHDKVADYRGVNKVDQRMSEETDSKASLQADYVESEGTDSQIPILHEPLTSEHTDHRLFNQAERASKQTGSSEQSASEQIEPRLSDQDDRRASEQIDLRKSGQYDRRASEPIDSRKSGLVDQKMFDQVEPTVSDQIDYKAAVKTQHKLLDQIAEDLTAEQADLSTQHSRIHKPDYRESDQVDEEDGDNNGNHSDFEESYCYGDRILTSKMNKADFRAQPRKLDSNQTHLHDFKVSAGIKDESAASLQVYNIFDARAINDLQANDYSLSPRFASISSQFNYVNDQEKFPVIGSKLDDISEAQEEKSSEVQNITSRKRFPSLVYQDPYQVALQYVEKHHILQIFQITENLVYERPEDPLNFMLFQVKQMIKERGKDADNDE